MKGPYNYKKIFTLLIAGMLFNVSWAQRVEKTQLIKKKYAVESTSRVELSNKYGNMHINTWDKDSVVINIEFTIKAKDAKRYNKMKSSVDFEFVETSQYIIARTLFLSSGKEIFRDLSSAVTSSSSSSISVNYEVFVPETARLHITNKYGNVYTSNLNSDVTFDLGYGTFIAHDFGGHTDLTLNNCNATINSIPVGIITLSYSDLTLTEAGSLKLNSRSSEVGIKNIEAITMDGKSDKIRVDQCEKATVTGNFTKFEVGNLKGDLNAKTKYGNLDIYLDKDHKGEIMVTSKYTDIILRVYNNENNVGAEIRHQRSKLAYPSGIARLTEQKVSGNDVIYHSSGTIGNGPIQNTKLTFFIESGDLSIFSR